MSKITNANHDVNAKCPTWEKFLNDVFEGNKDIVDFLVDTKFLPSKREARQALKDNSVSINKSKIKEGHVLSNDDLMDNLIVVQRGKRNFCLIEIL